MHSNHFQPDKATPTRKKLPEASASGADNQSVVHASPQPSPARTGATVAVDAQAFTAATAANSHVIGGLQIPPHSHPSTLTLPFTGYPPVRTAPYPYPPNYYEYPYAFASPHVPLGPHNFPTVTTFPPIDLRLHQHSHMNFDSHLQHRDNSTIHSNRSSPPPPPQASVQDMCTMHNLGPTFVARLEMLKFEIGDNLSVVTEEEWRRVGFDRLEWDRVLTAYRRYKRSFIF